MRMSPTHGHISRFNSSSRYIWPPRRSVRDISPTVSPVGDRRLTSSSLLILGVLLGTPLAMTPVIALARVYL